MACGRGTHMLSAGNDLACVAAQLGRANPAATLRIHAHWVPGTRRATTAVLERHPANDLRMVDGWVGGGETGEAVG